MPIQEAAQLALPRTANHSGKEAARQVSPSAAKWSAVHVDGEAPAGLLLGLAQGEQFWPRVARSKFTCLFGGEGSVSPGTCGADILIPWGNITCLLPTTVLSFFRCSAILQLKPIQSSLPSRAEQAFDNCYLKNSMMSYLLQANITSSYSPSSWNSFR